MGMQTQTSVRLDVSSSFELVYGLVLLQWRVESNFLVNVRRIKGTLFYVTAAGLPHLLYKN